MNDLVLKIERYFNSTLQYPLMIVVPSEDYKEILNYFSNTNKIKVSDYCVGEDKEPDISKLQDDVKYKTDKYLLIGLGDYLASKKNETKKILLPYKDMFLVNNSRIAILLCSHMYPVISEICNEDPRCRKRIFLPKITPTVEMVNSNELVYGIKAYLEACEKGERVGNVKSARDITSVNVINPDIAYDELKHKFPNEFGKLTQNSGTEDNWCELLENLNKTNMNIQQYLATYNFTSLEFIFLNYAKKDDFKAWLYFIYLKLNTTKSSYLGLVASKAVTLSELFNLAKTTILDVAVTDKQFIDLYEQRKTILKGCSDVDMASFIPKITISGDDRIAYLTDNTKIEKQAVIVSLCEGAKSSYLITSYPDLYFYLQDYPFKDQKYTDYFSLYKRCKVSNKIDNIFLNMVEEYAISRPYNSLPARSSLISDFDNSNSILFFLDALGVEYLGYVKEKCVELKLHFNVKIARADLPTITSLNRKFFDEWHGRKETPIKDLDDLKHHPERGYDYNNSPYPIHLVEELDIINKALERAKTKLLTGDCRKVIIASDHGASRLAVISPDLQIPSICNEIKSSGRYCLGKKFPIASNIVTDVEGEYAVIADYSRFAGSRAASVEVHGGATLEEVVVPIIELTLFESNIEVSLDKDIIEISYKMSPMLVLNISPYCENVTVAINGKFYIVEKLTKNKFKVILANIKKGKYMLDIFEDQNRIASKEFTVKSKGFAERDIL